MEYELNTLKKSLLSGFNNKKILVIGDLMLDQYILGSVERISPEAPVPILRFREEIEKGGGAANVALNLKNLGLNVALSGIIGKDKNGRRLKNLLAAKNIDIKLVKELRLHKTTTKIRILGERQQMLRIDKEDDIIISNKEYKSFQEEIFRVLNNNIDCLVLSDYAKGTLQKDICREIIIESNRNGIPVLVDPKGTDYDKYKGATLLSPNVKEISILIGKSLKSQDEIIKEGKKILKSFSLKHLVITRGEDGITLIEKDSVSNIPATALEVFDVSGAGDTVISTLAACVSNGHSIQDATYLANLAAGIVVGQLGTTPISRNALQDKLLGELNSEK